MWMQRITRDLWLKEQVICNRHTMIINDLLLLFVVAYMQGGRFNRMVNWYSNFNVRKHLHYGNYDNVLWVTKPRGEYEISLIAQLMLSS